MTTIKKHHGNVTYVTPFLLQQQRTPPVSISFPTTYCIHVGQLLSHQVGVK